MTKLQRKAFYKELLALAVPIGLQNLLIALIGATTFAFSALGVQIGHAFGSKFEKKAQLGGGISLILLGIKILLEHLGVL